MQLAAILNEAVARGVFPGAVFRWEQNGQLRDQRCVGQLGVVPPFLRPVQEDTLYDLASLTKLYTLTAYLVVQRASGSSPRDAVNRYLPGFGPQITVMHLLNHSAGLGVELQALEDAPVDSWLPRLAAAKPAFSPGDGVKYSCSNYFVLARVIEKLAGQSLDQVWQELLFQPLGLKNTMAAPSPRERVAPTEMGHSGEVRHAEVHDEAARSWWRSTGTTAGNAGLFATAEDVVRFAREWTGSGSGLLTPEQRQLALAAQMPENNHWRAWGWQVDAGFYMGTSAPRGTLGHLGFTGPSLVVYPGGPATEGAGAASTVAVCLCNRVHPRRDGPDRMPTLRRLHQCIFNAT